MSIFDVRKWYWIVNDTTPGTTVFSSASYSFVANNDATYLTWLAEPNAGGAGDKGSGYTINSAVDNGSGKTRISVDSTALLTTGERFNFGVNGNQQITVIDPTTIDLLGLNFSSYVAVAGFTGASIIDTAAHLYGYINSFNLPTYERATNVQSSSSDITLTNPVATIQDITLTGAASKVIMPPIAVGSPPIGKPVTINNRADDRTIGVYANDGTTLITKIDRGGSGSIAVKNNTTTNGQWTTNLDINRLTQDVVLVGNTNYSILNTDRVVSTNASFTAARTWTLPPAAQVNPGQPITIGDFFGGINFTFFLTLAAQGGETVNGLSSVDLGTKFGSLIVWSNGVNGWSAEISTGVAATSIGTHDRGLKVNNNAGGVTTKLDILLDRVALQDTAGTIQYRHPASSLILDISAAGPVANGRDQAGAFSAGDVINVFAIAGGLGTSFAYIASRNVSQHTTSGPSMPTGYLYWAYLFSVVLDGSGNLPTVHIFEDYERAGSSMYVASASTITLDTVSIGHYEVTGTTGINTITLSAGKTRSVRFQGALTLTNGANLVLPGGANITTAAGDWAIFYSDNGTVTRCVAYIRNDGTPLVDPALTGDVTKSAGSTITTIPNNTVTYAKMQDVSATSRVLGRKTAGAGDPEELTLSDVLDFIGSAAQGDILYRGASTWARLAAGTSGNFLKTQGAGANPVWDTASSGAISTATVTTYTSGSGTHTPQSDCKLMLVFLVGGGAGGAGGGTGSPGGGTNGNASTFGALTANGGTGGGNNNVGAAGGTGSGGNIANAKGNSSDAGFVFLTGYVGGPGGANPFLGGAGLGGGISPTAGSDGGTNTGGGGGGGGTSTTQPGAGGGAGAYVLHLYIGNPGALSYAVAATANGGAAGTNGGAGGKGAAGYIAVVELR